MRSPAPAKIADYIINFFDCTTPPIEIRHVVTELLQNEFGHDFNSATEAADKLWLKVQSFLQTHCVEADEWGKNTTFEFNSSSNYMLQGSCFCAPNDTEAQKEQKLNRRRIHQYIEQMRSLTPTEFEFLCGKVLSILGALDPVISQRSQDEGIDFYGKISGENLFFPSDHKKTIQKQLVVWMVGQAKQYTKTTSGTPELRDLVGSIYLARNKAYGGAEDPLSKLELRACDPIVYLFITNGSLSKNSLRLLQRSGVVGIDGNILSSFLADRGIGVTNSEFDKEAFMSWVNSSAFKPL